MLLLKNGGSILENREEQIPTNGAKKVVESGQKWAKKFIGSTWFFGEK